MLTGTVCDEITAAVRAAPDTRVVINSDTAPDSTTVGELFDESSRVAAGLRALGVGPGDVVAVQLPNRRECFTAHAAIWLCGAVVLPIVPIYGPAEVAFIARQSGAKAIVLARSIRNRDAGPTLTALADIPGLDLVILAGDPLPGTVSYRELTDSAAPGFAPAATTARDRCLLVYTSGTTAQPKGVQHSHAGLLGEMASMDEMRGHPSETPMLSVFPAGHIAGTLGILRMFCRAGTTVTMDAWNPEQAARLIAKYGVGSSAGAPIHLGGILDVAQRDGLDLSCLAEYTTGAAGVAGALIRRAADFGIGAFRCYGSSEHPTISSGRPEDPLDKRADTDGRITPGTEVRIVDDDGRDVEAGAPGEIWTRGPELFDGYTDPRHTRAALADGWFRTGDVGRLDDEGYLTITDRKKDIVIRGGENVSAKEVEDACRQVAGVNDVAIVGQEHDFLGQVAVAFVIPMPNAPDDLGDRIIAHCKTQLADFKCPKSVYVVDEFPRATLDKVAKNRLRELADSYVKQ